MHGELLKESSRQLYRIPRIPKVGQGVSRHLSLALLPELPARWNLWCDGPNVQCSYRHDQDPNPAWSRGRWLEGTQANHQRRKGSRRQGGTFCALQGNHAEGASVSLLSLLEVRD